MAVLVTGGGGYIGSHVVKALLEQTRETVVVVDDLANAARGVFATLGGIAAAARGDRSGLRCVQADIGECDLRWLAAHDIEAVIHLAGSIEVGESVRDPAKYYLNNSVNSARLVAACARAGVKRFVFSSTAAVYGAVDVELIDERTPVNPINPYGRSKLFVEHVLEDVSAAHADLSSVCLRYFNVAGAEPELRIGEAHEPETHLLPRLARAALGSSSENFAIFGDDYPTHDGTCVRDYIHVEDLADAHVLALEWVRRSRSRADAFNCGYGRGYSVREVIDTMARVAGKVIPFDVGPRRPGDPAVLVADATRIRTMMGWHPSRADLEIICRSALDWESRRTSR